ncbi:tyrosine/serine/threonine protein phosphatase [Coemansia sp. RSA 2336]|nr:tyrosine/serine/threonine protein phosphatase [Coemansia sp. RSA 2336]
MPMHRPSSSLSLSVTGLHTGKPIVREPQTPQLRLSQPKQPQEESQDSMLARRAARVYGNGPQQIMPYLYLGGEQNVEGLEARGITRVLNVAREVTRRADVQYMHMPWDHNEKDVAAYFDGCFAFIDEGRQRHEGVLVHCQLGVSRSASLVIAYVMRTMREGFRRAYEYVQLRAPCISPNLALISQLYEYGEQLDRGLVISTSVPESALSVPELTSASSENSSMDGSADCPCPVRTAMLPLVTAKPLPSDANSRVANMLLPIDQ